MTTSPVMGITEELLGVLEAEAKASLRENGTGFVERVTGFSVIDLVAEVRRLRAEAERLRHQVEAVAVRCTHNGGYLCSADLIELRELLKK